MIAWSGIERLRKEIKSNPIIIRPRWPLDIQNDVESEVDIKV